MIRKIRQSLGGTIFCSALVMCLIISVVALAASFGWYHGQAEKNLIETGTHAAATLAAHVPAETLDQYASGEADARYEQIMTLIRDMTVNGGVSRICILHSQGQVLFDSAGLSLGANLAATDALYSLLPSLQNIRAVDTAEVRERTGSRSLVVLKPVAYKDGLVAAHILVSVPAAAVANQQWSMILWMGLILLIVMLAVLGLYYYVIRKTVTQPIQKLTDAVRAYEGGENQQSIRSLETNGSDELQTLADAFRMMLVEIDLRGFEEVEMAVREERVESELKLTNAVNEAMEPKALPRMSGRLNFDIRGLSEHSEELDGIFYDYFLLENGKLGMVLGEVSSEGVSAALFMVIAKTILKSQLRVGMPLLEAVTEANRQLFEVGQGMVVNAMVGILDENGVFSYINAGQQRPLLMRAQDRYEWYTVPVYAPLGQNENVSYRVRQIALRQSDRLVFYTTGLCDIEGKDGESFGDRQLQVSLNASRSKNLNLDQLISYIHDEGIVFAEQPSSVGGFAILVFDYLRSRKDRAHCVVTRDSTGAMEIGNFLKRQLSENGFSQKTVAHAAVLADEVFSVCCLQKSEELITLECVVDRQQRIVTLHWKSAFGADPMMFPEGNMEHMLSFIRSSAKEISFRRGERQDVLTVVKQLLDE